MRNPRKTITEKRAEENQAQRSAWSDFLPRLQNVASVQDVLRLLAATPPPGSPGRQFFSNLGCFMQAFVPPSGASEAEMREYRRLIGIFEAEGVLKCDARRAIESALDKSISEQAWLN